MTDDEVDTLARLLRALAEEGRGLPHAPAAVFAALRGVVTLPTVELLLPGPDGAGAWLTYRKDRHWDGWHLPGGFVGAGESLEDACARVARRELGVPVSLDAVVGHHTWREHPYASALSLLCRCVAEEPPAEGRFFAAPPEPMIPEHRALLDRFHRWGGAAPEVALRGRDA